MHKKDIDFSQKRITAPSTPGQTPGANPAVFIRDLFRDEALYCVDDIMKILSISQSTAYRIISNLQKKLPGASRALAPGEIPKEFFEKQLYLYTQRKTE